METFGTVLRLHPVLAPFKACVLPLSKKLSEGAHSIFEELSKKFMVDYDDAGSIGKRYRRQDEIGTPFCTLMILTLTRITVLLFVTGIRWEQQRLPIAELISFLEKKMEF